MPRFEQPQARAFLLGELRLDLLNTGNITLPLGPVMRPPAGATPDQLARMAHAVVAHRVMPMQNVLLRFPRFVALVDAGAYDIDAGSSYFIPGYPPPPPLRVRLESLGVHPSSVQHVVITHRHWDHFNGLVEEREGAVVPLFPRARHYLQRPDWEHVAPKLDDPLTREARVFVPLRHAGLLEIVEGDVELAPGLSLWSAPGETPGHQVASVRSGESVAFLVGDLIHHPEEVALPEFMVSWADLATNRSSRRRVFAAAHRDDALLVASHIEGAGRVVGEADALEWRPAPPRR